MDENQVDETRNLIVAGWTHAMKAKWQSMNTKQRVEFASIVWNEEKQSLQASKRAFVMCSIAVYLALRDAPKEIDGSLDVAAQIHKYLPNVGANQMNAWKFRFSCGKTLFELHARYHKGFHDEFCSGNEVQYKVICPDPTKQQLLLPKTRDALQAFKRLCKQKRAKDDEEVQFQVLSEFHTYWVKTGETRTICHFEKQSTP